MKKLLALATAAVLSSTVSFAQDTLATAPAGMAATAPTTRPAMGVIGVIQSVDTAAKTIAVKSMMAQQGGERTVSYSDETLITEMKRSEVEAAEGNRVEASGRVDMEKKSVRLRSNVVGVYELKEGDKAPESAVTARNIIGTLKKDGEKFAIVVKTDAGEETYALESAEPVKFYAIEKVDATALKAELAVMVRGAAEGDTFKASEIRIMQMMGMGMGQRGPRGVGAATAPAATAPAAQ